MKPKEVLIIGGGTISGLAAALALAQKRISVTLLSSPFEQRSSVSAFFNANHFEEKIKNLQKEKKEGLHCLGGADWIFAEINSLVSLLLSEDNTCLSYEALLQEKLKGYEEVELLADRTVVELLTLERHSQRKADRYKPPTCIGVVLYNHNTGLIEYLLAKETILATGSAAALFSHFRESSPLCGGEIALALEAGARVLNMEQLQFYPLGLVEGGSLCTPLPFEFLLEGGQLIDSAFTPIEVHGFEDLRALSDYFTCHCDLYVDLQGLAPAFLKEKYPHFWACKRFQEMLASQKIQKIVPMALTSCGGVLVNQRGQTSVQRLRALGSAACTGLFCYDRDHEFLFIESLVYAFHCAEDIARKFDKFIYYFPDFRERFAEVKPDLEPCTTEGACKSNESTYPPSSIAVSSDKQEWAVLRQVMDFYAMFERSSKGLKRADALLNTLLEGRESFFMLSDSSLLSVEEIKFSYALQTARLVLQAMRVASCRV